MKRILAIGDTHCGHYSGLTPPAWWLNEKDGKSRTKRNKFAAIQRQLWQFYETNVKRYGPYDLVFFNGDAIDGRGSRSGSTELVTADLEEQCEMAVKCIRVGLTKATKLVMTYGTPYHVSPDGEDWESVIASDLGAEKIGSHEWVETDGVMFDLKHEVSSSSVPHGRHTSLARANLWSQLWSLGGKAPRGKNNVIIRSHVHYHAYAGGPGWLAMTLPALQGHGTKFGGRRCEGIVDFGITVFETNGKGGFQWHTELAEVSSQQAKAIRL